MYSVIGGGIAGLAAAYRLQQHGHQVHVYEASDDIGGLAAVYDTAGDPVEKYYHHLSKSEKTIVEIADELGVGDRIEWLVGRNAYYVDGEVHPLDTAWDILTYPHMSVYDKFRLGMLTLEVDVRRGIPSFDTYDNLESFEHTPIKDFLLEHTTHGVYEQFFEPLLDAKFGDEKEDVSAAWLLGRIKFRGERDLRRGEILGYFDGSFKILLDALIEAVGQENITTGARVTNIGFTKENVDNTNGNPTVKNSNDVDMITVETATGKRTQDTDGVVVATMPNVLHKLTGYSCEIDFQGAVCAVVTMEEPLTETYWLNIADDAPFGALIEHTNFVPPERYGGDHLLYIASYVQSSSEWLWQADDDTIQTRWLEHLEEMFPAFDPGGITEFRLARNPRAAPIYEQGYLDMVVPYDLSAEGLPGVYYAGMASKAQYPERSLNGGIVAGFECADRISERAN